MMSSKAPESPYTDRDEDGGFILAILISVTREYVSVGFSSPEYDAEFNFDNFLGVDGADAYSHPALIARFIERHLSEGEVKYHFNRRSDEVTRRG